MAYIPGGGGSSGGYDWDEITTVGSNNWTVPDGVRLIYVTLVGAGGGGGGASYTSAFAVGNASGGAGQILYRFRLAVSPLSSLTVTIGAGGAGALGSSANVGPRASTGGTSSIAIGASICLAAKGGGGGSSSYSSGSHYGGGASGSNGVGGSYSASTPTGYYPATLGIAEIVLLDGSMGTLLGSSGGGYRQAATLRRSFDPPFDSALGFDEFGPGLGFLLGPSCPAGVVGSGATRGKAPGYGGGGGPSTVAAEGATGVGGTGQNGYCLIEWGL